MEDNTQITTKKKNTGIIIGIVIAGGLAIVTIVAISIIIAIFVFGSPNRRLRHQLDLGDKYITELDYENAIIAYQNAIEIDPNSEEAYIKLADVYISQGNYEIAITILEDAYNLLNSENIKRKLDELSNLFKMDSQNLDYNEFEDIEDSLTYGIDNQELESNNTEITEIYDYEEYENIEINSATFPDDVFRNYVLENFDDGNGILERNDILNAQDIWLDDTGVSSLAGIEYLWNVMRIHCSNNSLQEVDFSNNTFLQSVDIDNNNITSININNSPNLFWLKIEDNQLTEIDISNDLALEYFACSNNDLIEIDISYNNNIESLSCTDNENLTVLNLGNNEKIHWLACFNCKKLSQIDISGCPQLLDFYNNGAYEHDDYFGYVDWSLHDHIVDGYWFCCDDVTNIITN